MDTGGDAATPGPPNATSAMSADDAWDLKQGELQPWAHNREEILADIKRKLENTKHSPVSYLETKYSSVTDKEQYARALWQELRSYFVSSAIARPLPSPLLHAVADTHDVLSPRALDELSALPLRVER